MSYRLPNDCATGQTCVHECKANQEGGVEQYYVLGEFSLGVL